MNPLVCIRGSASPGHSYPMTPLHLTNTAAAPKAVSYSVNPAAATTWLKTTPVKISTGTSANVPLTLVVPAHAAKGESYVILTAMGKHFDVRFSVGVPAPRECVAAGYASAPASKSTLWLWLILIVLVVAAAFWVRRRLLRR